MNRPSWQDAPEWANYLGYNSVSQTWYWYEEEPIVVKDCNNEQYLQFTGRKEFTGNFDNTIEVEKRPQ